MKAMNRFILIICILMLSAVHAKDSPLPQGIIALDGRPAPALKLNDMDGHSFDLKDSRGHWVFVHFWASWCGPCRREMPTIQTMAAAIKDTSLEIVLVNTAETDEEVFTFLGIVAPDLESLMDHDGLITERWQPRGLPSSFLVDPSGKLRYVALGGRVWDSPEYITFLRRLVTP